MTAVARKIRIIGLLNCEKNINKELVFPFWSRVLIPYFTNLSCASVEDNPWDVAFRVSRRESLGMLQ